MKKKSFQADVDADVDVDADADADVRHEPKLFGKWTECETA